MNIAGYKVRETLGKGAMATVYLAEQESLEREVALKVMAPQLMANSEFCQRFLKEGKIIANLAHPNIVTVFDIGVDQATYYMALEYAPGGTLTERLQQPIGQDQALQTLEHVARALSYAHGKGFVHRDVKPGNVLYRADGTALLSDFGIAKAARSSTQLTAAGWGLGTPQYMSPEQVSGVGVDARSDIYSLGIVFYEMLVGRRPYEDEQPLRVARMHVEAPVPTLPEEYAPLAPILARLLAKDRLDRFQDCDELLGAVARMRTVLAGAADTAPTQLRLPTAALRSGDGADRGRPAPAAADDGQGARVRAESGMQSPAAAEGRSPSTFARLLKVARRRGRTLRWTGGGLVLGTLIAVVAWGWLGRGDETRPRSATSTVAVPTAEQVVRRRLQQLGELTAAYQRVLAIAPDDAQALAGLDALDSVYVELGEYSWDHVGTPLALELLDDALRKNPGWQAVAALQMRIRAVDARAGPGREERREVDRLLAEGTRQLRAARYLFPIEGNAVQAYQRVLRIDPRNEVAQRRLQAMAEVFEQVARREFETGDLAAAAEQVAAGLFVAPRHPGLLAWRERLEGPAPRP